MPSSISSSLFARKSCNRGMFPRNFFRKNPAAIFLNRAAARFNQAEKNAALFRLCVRPIFSVLSASFSKRSRDCIARLNHRISGASSDSLIKCFSPNRNSRAFRPRGKFPKFPGCQEKRLQAANFHAPAPRQRTTLRAENSVGESAFQFAFRC